MTMTDGLSAPGGAATVSANAIVDLGNGETATVQELIDGNLRQSDYTRKTQELANERKLAERGTTLLNALDQDPQAAIELIARTYGVKAPSAPAPQAQPAVDEFGVPVETEASTVVDPAIQAELQQLRGTVNTLARTQQTTALQQEVARLSQEHGDAFDARAVLTHMQANNFPSVEAAFRDFVFEERNAAWVAQQQASAEQQRVIQEKQALVGVVQPAGVAGGAVEEELPNTDDMSFKEALRAGLQNALDQSGIQSIQDPQLLGT